MVYGPGVWISTTKPKHQFTISWTPNITKTETPQQFSKFVLYTIYNPEN